MSTSPSSARGRFARFGVFEADLNTGELRKNGSKMRLQEQPFQVLAVLLETPGEIVTRDDLRQRLWPADTFVDFDHSLNTAIAKLRDALGDSASSPRFIETLARRGYRFLAPVQWETGAVQNGTAATSQTVPVSSAHPELPVVHRGLTRTLFLLVQVMYLAFFVAALIHLDDAGLVLRTWMPSLPARLAEALMVLTACVGIPLRCYLFSAAAFDYPKFGAKFDRLFLAVLPLDMLWALAPFLVLHEIGLGAALAAIAALLYVPFGERTLVRMAYPHAGGP
jgi:DNA-binding winged helix-turn-helix (wHTH) protein